MAQNSFEPSELSHEPIGLVDDFQPSCFVAHKDPDTLSWSTAMDDVEQIVTNGSPQLVLKSLFWSQITRGKK